MGLTAEAERLVVVESPTELEIGLLTKDGIPINGPYYCAPIEAPLTLTIEVRSTFPAPALDCILMVHLEDVEIFSANFTLLSNETGSFFINLTPALGEQYINISVISGPDIVTRNLTIEGIPSEESDPWDEVGWIALGAAAILAYGIARGAG